MPFKYFQLSRRGNPRGGAAPISRGNEAARIPRTLEIRRNLSERTGDRLAFRSVTQSEECFFPLARRVRGGTVYLSVGRMSIAAFVAH